MTRLPLALVLSLAACGTPSSTTTSTAATVPSVAADTSTASAPSAAPIATQVSPTPSQPPQGDPIGALVARLSKQPLWTNGLSPNIELPATATVDEVLAVMFKSMSFDKGPVTRHDKLEVREVRIGADAKPYTAVSLSTDLGPKVVLLRYEGTAVGWWSRAFSD